MSILNNNTVIGPITITETLIFSSGEVEVLRSLKKQKRSFLRDIESDTIEDLEALGLITKLRFISGIYFVLTERGKKVVKQLEKIVNEFTEAESETARG